MLWLFAKAWALSSSRAAQSPPEGKNQLKFPTNKAQISSETENNKIWERPTIVNPEIVEGGGHKEENLLQEFQF